MLLPSSESVPFALIMKSILAELIFRISANPHVHSYKTKFDFKDLQVSVHFCKKM